jgi:hypothetical protein
LDVVWLILISSFTRVHTKLMKYTNGCIMQNYIHTCYLLLS